MILPDWRWRFLLQRHRVRQWLIRKQLPAPASCAARAFRRLKNARLRAGLADFAGLVAPAEPGLVSVVLPVYNGQTYVREAIDSLLAQTYPRFELIVVDDGSTDDTPAILDGYTATDARVRVLRQENQKLPAALNAGFRAARGEYLTWISHDNRMRPAFLERMVDCLRRHPGWDMVYANEDLIDGRGRPWRNSRWFPPYQRPYGSEHIRLPDDVSELSAWPENFIGAAFLYRAHVPFLIGEYDSSRFGVEDYDYWMRINTLLTLRHADFEDALCDYRYHDDSLTGRAAELDVVGHIRRLLLEDRGRRALCAKPLTWRIEAAPDSADLAMLAANLRNLLTRAGRTLAHVASIIGRVDVNVRFVAGCDAEAARPDVAGALNVLVATAPLPHRVSADWTLCLGWKTTSVPPRLPRDRQGWLAADRVDVLASTIEARARSHQWATLGKSATATETRASPCGRPG